MGFLAMLSRSRHRNIILCFAISVLHYPQLPAQGYLLPIQVLIPANTNGGENGGLLGTEFDPRQQLPGDTSGAVQKRSDYSNTKRFPSGHSQLKRLTRGYWDPKRGKRSSNKYQRKLEKRKLSEKIWKRSCEPTPAATPIFWKRSPDQQTEYVDDIEVPSKSWDDETLSLQ